MTQIPAQTSKGF